MTLWEKSRIADVGALNPISTCLEIRFLHPDITEHTLRDFKKVLKAANDGGIDSLEDEFINAHCVEAESSVIFQFAFSLMPCKSQSQNPDLERPSKKCKHASESDFEEPIPCNFFQNIRLEVFLNESSDVRSYAHHPSMTPNGPTAASQPGTQLMNNVFSLTICFRWHRLAEQSFHCPTRSN